MRVNIVLNYNNKSWIIEKIAQRLQKELVLLGHDASISEEVDHSADIIHHMSWAFANFKSSQHSTMMITHLDDLYKFSQIKSTLNGYVDVGICLSNDTLHQLVDYGCSTENLAVIVPGHDCELSPRKIIIGITTRLYPDGRKGEQLLVDLSKKMDLSDFEFWIFGKGWNKIIDKLRKNGANIVYFDESDDYIADYAKIKEMVPQFDYYLYLGMDEGALGTLDALMAGVKTIVTPQGYHLDVNHGITHPISDLEDLHNVFKEIIKPIHQRSAGVSHLTWKYYAEQHLVLWQTMIEGKSVSEAHIYPRVDSSVGEKDLAKMDDVRKKTIFRNCFQPRRMLSALSHLSLFDAARRYVDRLKN